eukprot:scaffold2492_cov50-Cyclotella_meneghiniana.AAC.5
MMGWKQAQNHETMTWTRHFDPHNIVNTGLPTTGASSAIHQYHLDECQMRRLALGCRSRPLHPFSPQIPLIFDVFRRNGNLRRNGCSGRDRPPELIAASGIHPNGIGEWPMKLRWSDVGCRQCCGDTAGQVIVTVHFYFYARERLLKKIVSYPSSLGYITTTLSLPCNPYPLRVYPK